MFSLLFGVFWLIPAAEIYVLFEQRISGIVFTRVTADLLRNGDRVRICILSIKTP